MKNEISLRQRILLFLERWEIQNPGIWVNGGEIERLALEARYKASNASRRCRELANEGYILRRENGNGSVEYKIAEPETIPNYNFTPTFHFSEPV